MRASEPRAVSLGVVLPAMLALALVLDVALRFAPLESVAFRPWEPASRYRLWDDAFEPGRRLDLAGVYGDLAAVGNLPAERIARRESFTTDALGFRNSEGARRAGAPRALLVGTSYSTGSAVDDDATLSVALGRMMGTKVYNAARVSMSPGHAVDLAACLSMPPGGTVLLEYLERNDAGDPSAEPGTLPVACDGSASLVARARARIDGLVQVSPLEILAQRALKSLMDDRVLPNLYRDRVDARRLPDGRSMLFLPLDVRRYEAPPDPAPVAAYLRAYREVIAAHGLRFVAVLAPSKYAVYAPWLPGARAPGDAPYLDRLERSLRDDGVEVVNLRSPLVAAAGGALGRGELLFHRDDTHWNAAGVEVAARAIAASGALGR